MSTSETAGQTRTARTARTARRDTPPPAGTTADIRHRMAAMVGTQPMAVILRQTNRGNSPRLMVMGLMKALYLALGRTNTQEVFKLCSGGEQFPARSDPHSMYEEI